MVLGFKIFPINKAKMIIKKTAILTQDNPSFLKEIDKLHIDFLS